MIKFISFSGPQGSGKTTLAHHIKTLCQKYDNYTTVFFPSITRIYLEKLDINLQNLRKNEEGLKIWQYFTLKEHFEIIKNYELLSEHTNLIVVMDRCYLDFLIYTEMFLGKKFKQKLESMFKDEINFFDINSIKFFVEPIFTSEDEIKDGIRDTSVYKKEIIAFEHYKEKFDCVVPPLPLEERIEVVKERLDMII